MKMMKMMMMMMMVALFFPVKDVVIHIHLIATIALTRVVDNSYVKNVKNGWCVMVVTLQILFVKTVWIVKVRWLRKSSTSTWILY